MKNDLLKGWDLFISHASEDKEGFVKPLADALTGFGVNVWYDDYALTIGDSLSRSIDQGLANSKFGLVVLSGAFIAKKWPEYELRGLTARELAGGKVILPIWHNISHEDLLKFSPALADKRAIKSSGLKPLQIAVKIIEVIRPDIFSHIARRIAFNRALLGSKRTFMPLEELRSSSFRHNQLSLNTITRIRLIRASLFDVFPQSLNEWVDEFRRDLHPLDEVAIWESVAAVFLECCIAFPQLTQFQKEKVFRLICSQWSDDAKSAVREALSALPDGAAEMIVQSLASSNSCAKQTQASSTLDRNEPA